MGCGVQRQQVQPPSRHADVIAPKPVVPVVATKGTQPPLGRTLHWLSIPPWQLAVAGLVIVALPAIGAVGAVNNWFEPLTGTVYAHDEVRAIRDDAKDKGIEHGQRLGYTDGYSKGRAAGHNEGLRAGEARGYDRGHNDGYAVGYEAGYDAGSDMGEILGRSRGYADRLSDLYDY
jgi:hypothetical protein